MSISVQIYNILKEEQKKGDTLHEIADKFNVQTPTIHRILTNQRPTTGLTIATVEKMFPKAQIIFDGNNSNQATAINNGTLNGNNQATINIADCNDKIKRILDAVMSSDLDDTAKVKVYQIINSNKE